MKNASKKISLHPLTMEQALHAALNTPKPKGKAKPQKKATNKKG